MGGGEFFLALIAKGVGDGRGRNLWAASKDFEPQMHADAHGLA